MGRTCTNKTLSNVHHSEDDLVEMAILEQVRLLGHHKGEGILNLSQHIWRDEKIALSHLRHELANANSSKVGHLSGGNHDFNGASETATKR